MCVKKGLTVKELMDAKKDLELDLMGAVNRMIKEFQHQTGITVEDIRIELVQVGKLNAAGRVNIKIDLNEE